MALFGGLGLLLIVVLEFVIMLIRREYKALARNGYWAVDEFLGNRCTRTIESGMKKRDAEALVGHLSNAIHQFCEDNNISA